MNVLSFFYLQHGQVDQALVLLRAAVALDPDDPNLLKTLAYAHLRGGEADGALDAIRRYQSASGDRAENSPIQLLRARALLLLGRQEEARALFGRFTSARNLPVAS